MREVNIIVKADGSLECITRGEVTEEEARRITELVAKRIGQRVTIRAVGPPESHRGDTRHAHVVSHGHHSHDG